MAIKDFKNPNASTPVVASSETDGPTMSVYKENASTAKFDGVEQKKAEKMNEDIGYRVASAFTGDVKNIALTTQESRLYANVVSAGIAAMLDSANARNEGNADKTDMDYGAFTSDAHKDYLNVELTKISCGSEETYQILQASLANKNSDGSAVNLNECFKAEGIKEFKFNADCSSFDAYQLKKSYEEYFNSSNCDIASNVNLKNSEECKKFAEQLKSNPKTVTDGKLLENYANFQDSINKAKPVIQLGENASREDIYNATKTLCLASNNELLKGMAKRGFTERDIEKAYSVMIQEQENCFSNYSKTLNEQFDTDDWLQSLTDSPISVKDFSEKCREMGMLNHEIVETLKTYGSGKLTSGAQANEAWKGGLQQKWESNLKLQIPKMSDDDKYKLLFEMIDAKGIYSNAQIKQVFNSLSKEKQLDFMEHILQRKGLSRDEINNICRRTFNTRDTRLMKDIHSHKSAHNNHNKSKKSKNKFKQKLKQLAMNNLIDTDLYQGYQIVTQVVNAGRTVVRYLAKGPLGKASKAIAKALKKTKVYQKVADWSRKVVSHVKRVVSAPFRAIRDKAIKPAKIGIKKSKLGKGIKKTNRGVKKAFNTVTKPFRTIGKQINKIVDKVKDKLAATILKPFAKIKDLLGKVASWFATYAIIIIAAIIFTAFAGPALSKGCIGIGGGAVVPAETAKVNADDFTDTYNIKQWINTFSKVAYYKKINEICKEEGIGTPIIASDQEAGGAQYKDYNIVYYSCCGERLDGFHSNMRDIVVLAYTYICQGTTKLMEFSPEDTDLMIQIAEAEGKDINSIITPYKLKEAEYLMFQYLVTVLWEASNELTIDEDEYGQPYIKWTTSYLTSVEVDEDGFPVRYKDGEKLDLIYNVDIMDKDNNIYTKEDLDKTTSLNYIQHNLSDGKHGLCNSHGSTNYAQNSGHLLKIYTNEIQSQKPTTNGYKNLIEYYSMVEGENYGDVLGNSITNKDFLDAATLIEEYYGINAQGNGFVLCRRLESGTWENGTWKYVMLNLWEPSYVEIGYKNYYRDAIWNLMATDWGGFNFYSPYTQYAESLNDIRFDEALSMYFNSTNLQANLTSIHSTKIDEMNVAVSGIKDVYQFRLAVTYWALKSVGNIPYYNVNFNPSISISENFNLYINTIKEISVLKTQHDQILNKFTNLKNDAEKDKNYTFSIYHYKFISKNDETKYKDVLGYSGIEKYKDMHALPYPSIDGKIGSTTIGLTGTELIYWIYESATSDLKVRYGDKPILLLGDGNSLSINGKSITPERLDLTKVKAGDILIADDGKMAVYIGRDNNGDPWIVMMSQMYLNSAYVKAFKHNNAEITIQNSVDTTTHDSINFAYYISADRIMSSSYANIQGGTLKNSENLDYLASATGKYLLGNASQNTVTYLHNGGTKTAYGNTAINQTNMIVHLPYNSNEYVAYLNALTNNTVQIKFEIPDGYSLNVRRKDLDGNLVCNYTISNRAGQYYIKRLGNITEDSKAYGTEILTQTFIANQTYEFWVGNTKTERSFSTDGTFVVETKRESVRINVKNGYELDYSFTYQGKTEKGTLTKSGIISVPEKLSEINLTVYKLLPDGNRMIQWCEQYKLPKTSTLNNSTYPKNDYVMATITADIGTTVTYAYQQFNGNISSPPSYEGNGNLLNVPIIKGESISISYQRRGFTDTFSQVCNEDTIIEIPRKMIVVFKNTSGNMLSMIITNNSTNETKSFYQPPGGTIPISCDFGDSITYNKANINVTQSTTINVSKLDMSK